MNVIIKQMSMVAMIKFQAIHALILLHKRLHVTGWPAWAWALRENDECVCVSIQIVIGLTEKRGLIVT